MQRQAAELLRDALALPLGARAALIDSLIDSLDQTVEKMPKKRGDRKLRFALNRSTAEQSN
jgi:hypothetical protein